MDDEDNDYETERQKTIAENRLLLDSLGLDSSGTSKIPFARPSTKPSVQKKRKIAPAKQNDEGPRRRSGRLAGLEADGEALVKREEEEQKEREILRVINRKTRDQVMELRRMVDEGSPGDAESLDFCLTQVAKSKVSRRIPDIKTSSGEAYADADAEAKSTEVARLKSAFKGMTLRANAKVTSERVFSMVVHPDPTKDLVFVGDKYGMLGIWDALGSKPEVVKDEDDTSGDQADEADEQGRVWQVQAHSRNSITCMKVDPIAGSGLFSSSYDCSLRHVDFASLTSTELFSFPDEDMLITHFDLVPNGREAWIADKNGGVSHCDFRQGKEDRRRWVVQEEGRAAKLGGLSVNPLMPHLIVTAGNDQHLRIWDVRQLSSIAPKPADTVKAGSVKPSTPVKVENGDSEVGHSDTAAHTNTHPSSSIPYEKIGSYLDSAKGKGLLRASYQHGKSCSAAYWDPWGRRILTTSYDDKLRVWAINPQSLMLESQLAPSHFQPSRSIPHNCQTGRWLTILRAQWSLNMDYMPHFTVGNMKRSLDVITANGDKIVSLWTDAVTAVPAVTASHPNVVNHVFGGNTSGRIQLWAPAV